MTELVCLECFTTYCREQGHFCVNGSWIPVIPDRNIPFKLIENQVIWNKESVINSFDQCLRENSDILNRTPELSAEAGIYDELNFDNDRLENSNRDSAMGNMPGEHDIIALSNDVSVENEEKNQTEHESKVDNNTDSEMTSVVIRQAEKNNQWSNVERNTSNNLTKNRKGDPQEDFTMNEAEIASSFMASKFSTVTNKEEFAKNTVFKSNQMKPNSNNIEKIQNEYPILSTSYEIGSKNTDFQTTKELPEQNTSNTEKSKLANECAIVYEHAVAGPSRLDFNQNTRLSTSYNFQSKQNLQTHVGHHTSEKGFKCEFCRKPFASIETLIQHEGTYFGERICCICQQKLCTNSGLRIHIRNIHNKTKRIECEICKRKFFFKQSFEYHTKYCHT